MKYPVVTEQKRIGTVSLSFTRVADADAVLDAICAEETRRAAMGADRPTDVLRMPYWAAVWESATAVGQLLCRRPELCRGSCLDLGCGQGLAGMVAAELGAQVVLADIDEDCLEIAGHNVARWADRCEVRLLNWQRDELGRSFDLIIGSDVLYERDQWEFIEAFLQKHIHVGSKVVLGEPGRSKADEFPGWILERGWQLETLVETVPERAEPIRVFLLRRAERTT
jgi:predicted nicotinamide N-methyase